MTPLQNGSRPRWRTRVHLLSKRSTSSRTLRDQRSLPKAPARESASRPHQEADSTPAPTKAKKHLLDAPNECISLHQQQKAWNAISIGQVRTALALFDYACGGGILIEDLQHKMYWLSLNYAEHSRTGGAGRPRKKLAVSPPASRGRRLCRPMRSVLGKPRSTST